MEKQELNKRLKNLLSSNSEKCVIEQNSFEFNSSNEAIKNDLLRIISPHYPFIEIYLFGSRAMGVASASSDLDIYVDINQSYCTIGKTESAMQALLEIKQIIVNDKSDEWVNLYVKSGEIPLIKVFNKKHKIKCDISFSGGESHRNTTLMKFFCELQPDFRKMIIVLGQWLEYADLSTYINNHTLRLLILNYLQILQLLPSIRALQVGIRDPLKIGPWNADFHRTAIYVTKVNNLDNLIKGFFKHYGLFGRFDGIVCIYFGTLIPKDFCSLLDAYTFSTLNIRGPFNLAENPAKKISKAILKQFIDFAQMSHTFLANK